MPTGAHPFIVMGQTSGTGEEVRRQPLEDVDICVSLGILGSPDLTGTLSRKKKTDEGKKHCFSSSTSLLRDQSHVFPVHNQSLNPEVMTGHIRKPIHPLSTGKHTILYLCFSVTDACIPSQVRTLPQVTYTYFYAIENK